MTEQSIRTLIKEVLSKVDGGVTVEELQSLLKDEYGVDRGERSLQSLLKRMVEAEDLERGRVSTDGPGRPPYYYFVPSKTDDEKTLRLGTDIPDYTALNDQEDLVPMDLRSRGDISLQEDELKSISDLPDGVYWDIVETQLDNSKLVQRIKEAAPEIADLDPLETILDMVEWTVDQINVLGEKLWESHQAGATGQLRATRDLYDDLAGWAKRYFHEFWQLTRFDTQGPDILRIPDRDRFINAVDRDELNSVKAKFDRKKAASRLKNRLFGDRLIWKTEIDENIVDVVGTDSSVARVSLPNRSRLTPDTVFELYAGAAALNHDERRFTDFDFDPKNLKEYRQREAFKKGLLMSQDAIPQLAESQVKKARFAALDLRQYLEVTRVINDMVNWRPHGDVNDKLGDYTGPDVMYMDGRLTPIVHLMSEFTSDDLYGELVRRQMRQFARVANLAHDDNWETNTTFAGVVKEPGISWFSPIIFWFLETQCDDDVERDLTGTIRNVCQPPLSDVVLPHILFRGLSEENGVPNRDEVYTTFRVLRRFFDNSVPKRDLPPVGIDGELINVDSIDGWMSYFEEVQRRKKEFNRETIDLEKYRKFGFASACANVGSLMCYAGPPNLYTSHQRTPIRLPRIEVLVNPAGDSEDKMRKAVSAFASKNYSDDEHAIEGYDRLSEVPVVVPRVIVESDKIAKYARDRISDDVTHNIYKAVQELSE
ncbi:hypothetical protein KU306_02460 [Haloferax larsenii]|uniref:Uncharacterized protein n=1 Tax=Haloferax larsenii TaxID=302484 RepID=A0ABY5RFV7_HALLR|nr:hypothetical protein [Haloferax larsenii]UVE50773.1 hypothetical protein KU306_02460 [Haloferax larsenii]